MVGICFHNSTNKAVSLREMCRWFLSIEGTLENPPRNAPVGSFLPPRYGGKIISAVDSLPPPQNYVGPEAA